MKHESIKREGRSRNKRIFHGAYEEFETNRIFTETHDS